MKSSRIIVAILLLCMFSESLQLPLELPVGTQLKGVLLCQSPAEIEQKSTNCWFLQPNRNYDLYLQDKSLSENESQSRTNLQLQEPKDSERTSLARFNIHLYLDHMWHLNIGFTR